VTPPVEPPRELIAFIAATDAARARRFYGETLGFALESEDGFALVFRVGQTMLRVTLVEEVVPVPYTVLGWAVAEIDAAVRELSGRGVGFLRYPRLDQDVHGVWRSPGGARVAWFEDPDGNVLSLTQL
jgi:catechol 2,3-dioxygenase-like lactoylglutathione lyase family enzyme